MEPTSYDFGKNYLAKSSLFDPTIPAKKVSSKSDEKCGFSYFGDFSTHHAISRKNEKKIFLDFLTFEGVSWMEIRR